MRPITMPFEAAKSQEFVLRHLRAAAERDPALVAKIRIVRARPEGAEDMRTACGRIDVARPGEPRPHGYSPREHAEVLDQEIAIEELERRLRDAFSGAPFRVLNEDISDHGMGGTWEGTHLGGQWHQYGASWPFARFSPSDAVPRRPYFNYLIEDEETVHRDLEHLLVRVMGFGKRRASGTDTRFHRIMLAIWDYRGRIDDCAIELAKLSVEISPPRSPEISLVGVIDVERGEPTVVRIAAPASAVIEVEAPVTAVKLELKSGRDVITWVQRDLAREAWERAQAGAAQSEISICLALAERLRLSLRPIFGAEPPANERVVQEEIEKMLRTLDVPAKREKDRNTIGSRTFVPDFTVPDLGLAIEVKLATASRPDSAIQRELVEDVTGYSGAWRNLIVIIYDCGTIRNPDKLVHDLFAQHGVIVAIVKH